MMQLIPQPKEIKLFNGFLSQKTVKYCDTGWDSRVSGAAQSLPYEETGVPLEILFIGNEGEGYQLDICVDGITITADGPAGAFYGIQTLRQLFTQEKVPCLHMEDRPDFAYRGFYHDVSRGKIPNMETLKQLIDRMAYYKLNSLQLYVEHTFEFRECKDICPTRGCLTKAELQELDTYCRLNFIHFIPSLSTFGHMYEILQQPKYQHLRSAQDDEDANALWHARMKHHTLDPRCPESLALVQSLMDQFAPCFTDEWFNICCDETFDLYCCADSPEQIGQLYVQFVKKIIAHMESKGKKVMMWADILLSHPEMISELPEDVCFLNWWYWPDPNEERFAYFARIGRSQILCPGTTTWSRLCENVDVEERNICQLARLGQKYGAAGLLITNWGDWGNPCSLELAMYGLVLGAEKSWSVATAVDDGFYDRVNALLYENESGVAMLKSLCSIHNMVGWSDLGWKRYHLQYQSQAVEAENIPIDLPKVQKAYTEFQALLTEKWKNDEFRQEMLLAAEGLCVIAELQEKMDGKQPACITDTNKWLARYREKWLQKNKPNELYRIEELFHYCESI